MSGSLMLLESNIAGQPAASVDQYPQRNPTESIQGKCYGCATSATEHCLILLRALAVNSKSRVALCNHGLVQELVQNNLRMGTLQVITITFARKFGIFV